MNTSILLFLLFIVPFLSGVTVIAIRPWIGSNIKLLLSFSASFLLAICFTHLLPEVFESHHKVGYFVLGGFFIQILLEYLSAGIEHGHMHHSSNTAFPYLVFLSLCIHSFIEGFPLVGYTDAQHPGDYSNALLAGILLHKIPIAIVLITILLEKKIKLSVIIVSLLLFSLTAPLSILSIQFSLNQLEWINTSYLTAISIGIFLHISTVILFESSKNHQFNLIKFLTILMGILLAIFTFGTH